MYTICRYATATIYHLPLFDTSAIASLGCNFLELDPSIVSPDAPTMVTLVFPEQSIRFARNSVVSLFAMEGRVTVRFPDDASMKAPEYRAKSAVQFDVTFFQLPGIL